MRASMNPMKPVPSHSTSQWVTAIPSSGRSLGRLFCFPFAGGGASAYYPWKDRIIADVELVRIHLPGRETRLREPLATCVKPLVETLVEELISWMDRPFAFFGHSMGALLAFELAKELRRRYNLLPAHLFVSGFWAPHLPPPRPPFSHLPNSEFIDRVREYGGIPELVSQNEELMEIFTPILRADFQIIETYRYRPEMPLECPLTAFGGFSDPKIGREKISAWKIHTSNCFTTNFFPGGHFFVHTSEASVLDQINFQLAQLLLAC